ncbi:MAG: helix-turn-helix domain-containing protein [Anaerolineae bacterium]|nr:helix-turn-helix domain-containing protein [Anaerolineae bacterium]MDW8298827.1 helix-turn-helix domain-containing protein [Anaerolineae bacterium]
MNAEETTTWVSLSEAARLLGVHPATVRNWADQGYLPSQRTPGGHRRFRVADLESWRSAQQSSAALEAEVLVQSALGRVRLELSERHFAEAGWYRHLDAQARQALGVYGRQLMEVMQRYLSSPSEQALIEARQLGLKYGQTIRSQNLKLSEAIEGFFAFTDVILDAMMRVIEIGRPAAERADAVRKVYALTREIIFALVDAYEA